MLTQPTFDVSIIFGKRDEVSKFKRLLLFKLDDWFVLISTRCNLVAADACDMRSSAH